MISELKYNNQGVGSKYYYDGDKLITEVAANYRLDFLYDENNQLYGFIYNNDSKYYYIRDFMQNKFRKYIKDYLMDNEDFK